MRNVRTRSWQIELELCLIANLLIDNIFKVNQDLNTTGQTCCPILEVILNAIAQEPEWYYNTPLFAKTKTNISHQTLTSPRACL